MNALACDLCTSPGGRLIHDDGRLRVVVVDEIDYPGFVRVVWNQHVREMTDLSDDERSHLMRTVFRVEAVQRDVMRPVKMNVASLGNLTPHVHWHLVPRHEDDAHFPRPIWAERSRTTAADVLETRRARVPALERALAEALRAPE
jgi:diadenosine tetraphosphate (Ap4A) HIT family hydrolase